MKISSKCISNVNIKMKQMKKSIAKKDTIQKNVDNF
jgi:hypothetical protein